MAYGCCQSAAVAADEAICVAVPCTTAPGAGLRNRKWLSVALPRSVVRSRESTGNWGARSDSPGFPSSHDTLTGTHLEEVLLDLGRSGRDIVLAIDASGWPRWTVPVVEFAYVSQSAEQLAAEAVHSDRRHGSIGVPVGEAAMVRQEQPERRWNIRLACRRRRGDAGRAMIAIRDYRSSLPEGSSGQRSGADAIERVFEL